MSTLRRVSVREFRGLVTSAAEPLQVTSHGFPVGMWFPAGTEPADTSTGYARAASQPSLKVNVVPDSDPRREFRPATKVAPKR